MKLSKFLLAILLVLSHYQSLAASCVETDCCDCDCCEEPFRHQPFIGPEIYYVKRVREGGTHQDGYMFGVRLGYDYIRRYAFYFGADALYAQGTLKGETGEGLDLKSQLTDANVEGRIGYTFQTKGCYHASLTPFVGAGYFWEINKFKDPSPNHFHFYNRIFYVPIGFLSSIFVLPELSIGVNFKARIPIEGKIKVENDEETESDTLRYEEKWQYRVDVPITYYFCWSESNLAISLVPFYEYRHYGYKANFPYDFLDTKFNIYGGTLKFLYLF
jgi:hypothetical protein